MRKIIFFSCLFLAFAVVAGNNFKHSLPPGKKPWTHEKFLADDGKFTFFDTRARAHLSGLHRRCDLGLRVRQGTRRFRS